MNTNNENSKGVENITNGGVNYLKSMRYKTISFRLILRE